MADRSWAGTKKLITIAFTIVTALTVLCAIFTIKIYTDLQALKATTEDTVTEEKVKRRAQQAVALLVGGVPAQSEQYRALFADKKPVDKLAQKPLRLSGQPRALWASQARTNRGSDWQVTVQADYVLPSEQVVTAHYFRVRVAVRGDQIGIISLPEPIGVVQQGLDLANPYSKQISPDSELAKTLTKFYAAYFNATPQDLSTYVAGGVNATTIAHTGFATISLDAVNGAPNFDGKSLNSPQIVMSTVTAQMSQYATYKFQSWLTVNQVSKDHWVITDLDPTISMVNN